MAQADILKTLDNKEWKTTTQISQTLGVSKNSITRAIKNLRHLKMVNYQKVANKNEYLYKKK